MTAVRFKAAATYAVTLFGYLLAVAVVAAGSLSLGFWVARDEIAPALGAGTADKAALVGGGALIVIGTAVLSIGLISAIYKLLADAVHAGRVAGSPAPAETAEAEQALEPDRTVESTSDRETTPIPADEGDGGSGPDRSGRTAGGAAAAASDRARAAQEASEAEPGADLDPDTDDAGPGDATAGIDRETSPDPATVETSPEPPDRETEPEPAGRETGPDRETNPDPPDAGGDRPEPSAEEIAFGSGSEPDTEESGSEDDAASMFTSKAVSGESEDGADGGEEPDPMWGDEPADAGGDDGGGTEFREPPSTDEGFREPPSTDEGFREPPSTDEGVESGTGADDEEVEATGGSDDFDVESTERDPLADE